MNATRTVPVTGQTAPFCLWMQAGVVRRKQCRLDYQCAGCRYDRLLGRLARSNRAAHAQGRQPGGRRGRILPWKDRLMELAPSRRPCVHHMKGRIDFRSCTHRYRCGDCEFDQYFDDQYTVHAVVRPVDLIEVHGFRIPQGFYLHPGHAWLKIESGGQVRIGLDDFSLRVLGPPDRIEAPLVGKTVRRGEKGAALYREGLRADLRSPVTGVVTAVNHRLREDARESAEAPYDRGWICRIHAEDLRTDLRRLMFGPETRTFLAHEADRLMGLVESVAGPLAADGGVFGPDLYGAMPQLGWRRLARRFLRT